MRVRTEEGSHFFIDMTSLENAWKILVCYAYRDTLDQIRSRFDKKSGQDFMDRLNRLSDQIVELQKENVPVENEQSQQVVQEYWSLIMEFTNGDMSMLPKLMEVGNIDTASNAWEEKQKIVNDYLGPALQVYFSRLGTNPLEEVEA